MERLTYDFCIGGNHCWQVQGADNLECREVCQCQEDKGCKDCPIAKAFDRLASIEDILGDEYDLDELREMVQAKREGRCVVLPCEAGHEISYKSGIGLRCNAVIDEYTPENIFITAKTDIPNAEPLRQTFSLSEIEAALRREQE